MSRIFDVCLGSWLAGLLYYHYYYFQCRFKIACAEIPERHCIKPIIFVSLGEKGPHNMAVALQASFVTDSLQCKGATA